MTTDSSTYSLPRSVANGMVRIVSLAHAEFGDLPHNTYDAYLTPDGSATILGPLPAGAENEDQRPQIIPIDAASGLVEFLQLAERQHGKPITYVCIGMDTLAHLFAQRVVRQQHLTNEWLNTTSDEPGVWKLFLHDDEGGLEDDISLKFSTKWNGQVIAVPSTY